MSFRNSLPLIALLPTLSWAEPMPTQSTSSVYNTSESKAPESQGDYYKREVIPTPKDVTLEATGIAILPDQKVAVASRRGDIWVCSGAYGEDLAAVTWQRFATGLHEPLGIFYRDGSIYATDRAAITKMTDNDGDGVADSYRTVNDSWGVNGDYHEYNFGSTPDQEGNIWVVHCLTGSGRAESDWRGWAFRYDMETGNAIPTASGIRSPGGIGFNAEGDCFYTDNQGHWNGSSSLKWLNPGSFQGNPTGTKYAELAGLVAPPDPVGTGNVQAEYELNPSFQRPAVMFPHSLVGQSPTGIITDDSAGKFGPFAGQLLVGEQTHSEVQRVYLEKVKGQYQGAVWKHLSGFQSGIVSVKMGDNGVLFTGGTNRGWGSRGKKPFSFERVTWTGVTPFSMQQVNITEDGFIIHFTHALADQAAADVANYKMGAWSYQHREKYGSEGYIDPYEPTVTKAEISPDKMSVRLTVDKLTRGHVHQLTISDAVQSEGGSPLWQEHVFYTVNETL